MHRNTDTAREKQRNFVENFDILSKTLQVSKAMQTRYQLIPQQMLNKVTVAGVRDIKIGRLGNDGKPVGGNVVRFNNPSPNTKSDYHRICIDPKGVSSKANPHIAVWPCTVKAAENIQKGLKIAGRALLVVSIVASGVRIIKEIYDEVTIDEEIEAMEAIVECLQEDLRNSKQAAVRKSLDFAESLLENARDCKRNPGKKTFLKCLCIGSEWVVGAGLATAGATVGASVGSAAGPVGSIAGAVTGAVLGGVVGGSVKSVVENAYSDEDGVGTELQGSMIQFGEKIKSEVMGVDGNAFIGKGVEVGARAAVFQTAEKGEGSFKLIKAGANAGVTNKGVDVSVEAKAFWAEAEDEKYKVGFGVNADTGFKLGSHGADFSLLGFGFKVGDDGWGFQLPLLNVFFKS